MSDYDKALTIQASPEEVFRFVSEISNLPKYLPTVHNATPQQGDRVRVQGESGGHRYDSDGYFRLDEINRRMEWGSDGENDYKGWLQVKDGPDPQSSEVLVHLSFEPRPEMAERMDDQSGNRHRAVHEGLEDALQSIKYHCEGRAGMADSTTAR